MGRPNKSSGAFVTFEDKFLLFHRDNIPQILDPDAWGLLGGRSEPGETPDQTLIRELQEEANITPTDFGLLFIDDQWDESVYHIRLSENQVKEIRLGDEGQGVEFFTLDQVQKLKLSTTVKKYFKENGDLIKSLIQSARGDSEEGSRREAAA